MACYLIVRHSYLIRTAAFMMKQMNLSLPSKIIFIPLESARSSAYLHQRNSAGMSSSTTSPLSRASIYAPLKSYDAAAPTTVAVAPGQRLPSVPKSCQDAALLSFWSSVSEQVHRTVPRVDCKNTAGRPLSTAEMTNRMQQRSLTLVGGGYNNNSSGSSRRTTASSRSANTTVCVKPRALSKRQCRRKRRELMRRLLHFVPRCGSGDTTTTGPRNLGKLVEHQPSLPSREPQALLLLRQYDAMFLQRLHWEWRHYISSLVAPFVNRLEKTGDLTNEARWTEWMARQADTLEWVGAHVTATTTAGNEAETAGTARSPRPERLVGTGILVAQSQNAWTIACCTAPDWNTPPIAPLSSNNVHTRSDTSTVTLMELARDDQQCTNGQRLPGPRIFTIPKEGTLLTASISLDGPSDAKPTMISIVLSA
jgi:hypothetical protein